jgi:hypothetical protein
LGTDRPTDLRHPKPSADIRSTAWRLVCSWQHASERWWSTRSLFLIWASVKYGVWATLRNTTVSEVIGLSSVRSVEAPWPATSVAAPSLTVTTKVPHASNTSRVAPVTWVGRERAV